MAKPERIHKVLLDASCLIGIIKGEPAMSCLRSLLAAVDREEVRLVESTAILAEVLPQHTDSSGGGRRAEVLELLESASVELVDVSSVVARRAAELRIQYNLKTWDAIHISTAVVARANVVMARDSRFPYGTTLDGVYVAEPFDIDEDKLFSG